MEKKTKICYDKKSHSKDNSELTGDAAGYAAVKNMNQKALISLEYYKIIERLTEKASSPMGKDLCRKLLPSTDLQNIRLMQTQTRDALTRLFQKGSVSFGSVKDIRGSLKRLEIGSSLGIIEILSVCSLLENTSRIKAYSRSDRSNTPEDSLDPMFDAL